MKKILIIREQQIISFCFQVINFVARLGTKTAHRARTMFSRASSFHYARLLVTKYGSKRPSTNWKVIIYCSLFFVTLLSCQEEVNNFDATGTFEAIETIISSEANGALLAFNVEEGQELRAGQSIGLVDTVQLHLKVKQLEAQIKAIGSRAPNVAVQTSYFDEQLVLNDAQLANLTTEQNRLEKLVAGDAAPQKQLDDIIAKIVEIRKHREIILKQKAAQVSALQTQSRGLNNEPLPLFVQIDQLKDQLTKCRLINPIPGTVLTKFAEAREMTSMGKPLYKIADLSSMILRAYITGDQLPSTKINQKVKVSIDDGDGAYLQDEGTITWISTKAEFTPKTIQTKDERANLVYAIKVKVPNDGRYKIGMYGEINFL